MYSLISPCLLCLCISSFYVGLYLVLYSYVQIDCPGSAVCGIRHVPSSGRGVAIRHVGLNSIHKQHVLYTGVGAGTHNLWIQCVPMISHINAYSAFGNKVLFFEPNNVFFQKKLFGSEHSFGSNNSYASPAGSERKNVSTGKGCLNRKNVSSPKWSQNCKKMNRWWAQMTHFEHKWPIWTEKGFPSGKVLCASPARSERWKDLLNKKVWWTKTFFFASPGK